MIIIGNSYLQYNVYNLLKVLAEDIVDVKEGQDSDGFDRYPYEEVEDQSFSLLYEGEILGSLSCKDIYKVTIS